MINKSFYSSKLKKKGRDWVARFSDTVKTDKNVNSKFRTPVQPNINLNR